MQMVLSWFSIFFTFLAWIALAEKVGTSDVAICTGKNKNTNSLLPKLIENQWLKFCRERNIAGGRVVLVNYTWGEGRKQIAGYWWVLKKKYSQCLPSWPVLWPVVLTRALHSLAHWAPTIFFSWDQGHLSIWPFSHLSLVANVPAENHKYLIINALI